jgi:Asp-tRNA(Asn)/Glu-tRNA(Gln) amidotransferase A subunit family amidase
MTVAIKDNIDLTGLPAASGSRLFAGRIAPSDAPVVARLREAGAIMIGKTAMMELAFGVRSLDAVAGQCRNPWDPARVPGGSSGGSAIAVALHSSLMFHSARKSRTSRVKACGLSTCTE